MKSIFSPNVQENKVSSPKIQTQHIIKQHASACVQSHFSRVRLLATPWTIAHQAPLSTGFSRQEITGVGYHALLWGIFLTQESKLYLLCLLHWQESSLPLVPPGKTLHKAAQKPSNPFIKKSWGKKKKEIMGNFWAMKIPTQAQVDVAQSHLHPPSRDPARGQPCTAGLLARWPANTSVWPAWLKGQGSRGIRSGEGRLRNLNVCGNFHISGRVGGRAAVGRSGQAHPTDCWKEVGPGLWSAGECVHSLQGAARSTPTVSQLRTSAQKVCKA